MDHWRNGRDCNPCTSYWSHCWPKTVCIFLVHTIPVQNLAKPNHRKIYKGNALTYSNLATGACGFVPPWNGVIISSQIFDSAPTASHSNYSSLCGHNVTVSGTGSDGVTGADVQGSTLTLSIFDRSKCTGLRQPYDRKWKFDQQDRHRLRARRPHGHW